MKKNKLKLLRYLIQAMGLLLTIVGVFTDFPVIKSVLLGVTFIMGPVFCGWICPFGTLQDIFSRIGRKLKIKKRTMPKGIQKTLSITRYILLGIAVFISLDFVFTLFSYDPQSNLVNFLTGYSITVAGWGIIIGFSLLSMVYERPFCNHLCIEGARYGLVGAIRPITITRNENTCIDCGRCNKACPMHIDVMGHKEVRSLQCINCLECVTTCPVKNTLNIGVTTLGSNNNKLKTLVTSMFIVLGLTYILFNISNAFNSGASEISTSSALEELTTSNEAGYIDGTYTGSGTGFRGSMNVEVTIDNGLIESVEVTDYVDDEQWFNQAYSTIVSSILQAQSTEVDTVSGATYSSIGIIEGVENALVTAMGATTIDNVSDTEVSNEETEAEVIELVEEVEVTEVIAEIINSDLGAAQGISDGSYTGTGSGFRGDLTVEVIVENELITQVTVIEYSDDENWFQKAYSTVVNSIIEEQTPDVDSVSGATYSSLGIKEAVSSALIDAGGTDVPVIENDSSQNNHKGKH